MFFNIFVIFCIALFQGLNVYASRGWYVSVGGVSAKQDHDISNYSRTQSVDIIKQSSVQGAPSIPSDNVYWFAQDANNQDTFGSYSNFATLQNALNSSYILNTTSFNLINDIGAGTSSPFFTITSGGGNVTLSDNTTPTNITGGNITNGVITHTGTNQQVATIDRYNAGSASLYKVTLNPITYSETLYKGTILAEVQSSSTASIGTAQQMQDFVSLFNGKTSRTAEVSFGYKFRPFRSPLFIAPQIDFTYFKNNSGSNQAFVNSTGAISLAGGTNSRQVQYSSMDLSYTASLIFKLGFEQRFWVLGTKIPFSIYGLFGGSSSFRNINTIRDNAFGFKYGIGGELFVSQQLAFFGEFYQIQYISQDYIFNQTSSYAGNAFNSTNGFTATLSNGGTGGNGKTININYPSDSQRLAATVNTNEKYTLQSKISAFKVGLTYYFE